MPEYRRGVAVAYCDSSGPARGHAGDVLRDLADAVGLGRKQRVESFYREYNQSMLAELTIHEAMPGHYLQLMHNNQFASKLRAVFASGPFVEGWAVYGEWLMAENGFGGPRVKLAAPEDGAAARRQRDPRSRHPRRRRWTRRPRSR